MSQVISTIQVRSRKAFHAFSQLVWNRRGDDYGEKAVILVLVVLGGVAAFAAFGGKVVEMISQATGGM